MERTRPLGRRPSTTVALCASFLSACAFQGAEGPFGPDPFASSLEPVSERFCDTWLILPTGLGNVVGCLALSPIALFLVAPVELIATGESDATATCLAAGAYGGGFLIGTPFLGLHWAGFRFWYENFDLGGQEESQ